MAAPAVPHSSSAPSSPGASIPTQVIAFVVSLAAVAAVSLIGRSWTDTDTGSWYDRLDKPPITPPGAVFGIVWGVLYFAIGLAAWLVAREGLGRSDVRRALALYVVQLVLNLGWTFVFFNAELPGWALVEIVFLVMAAVATMLAFRPISRPAFWLFVPYVAWVSFATVLTASFCLQNL